MTVRSGCAVDFIETQSCGSTNHRTWFGNPSQKGGANVIVSRFFDPLFAQELTPRFFILFLHKK